MYNYFFISFDHLCYMVVFTIHNTTQHKTTYYKLDFDWSILQRIAIQTNVYILHEMDAERLNEHYVLANTF